MPDKKVDMLQLSEAHLTYFELHTMSGVINNYFLQLYRIYSFGFVFLNAALMPHFVHVGIDGFGVP